MHILLGMVMHLILTLSRCQQEDCKFGADLDCMVGNSLFQKVNKTQTPNPNMVCVVRYVRVSLSKPWRSVPDYSIVIVS